MRFLNGLLRLFSISLALVAVLLPLGVVLHEGTHYLLYTMEGIPVSSFHVLDSASFENGCYGFVATPRESRYGGLIHEGIASSATYLFFAAALLFTFLVPLKPFMVHQLKSMGLRRNIPDYTLQRMEPDRLA